MIRPASEMSLVPTLTPAADAKERMMGSRDALANSGASSTIVYNISGFAVSVINFLPFKPCGSFCQNRVVFDTLITVQTQHLL
jgi:hypothetical protein